MTIPVCASYSTELRSFSPSLPPLTTPSHNRQQIEDCETDISRLKDVIKKREDNERKYQGAYGEEGRGGGGGRRRGGMGRRGRRREGGR